MGDHPHIDGQLLHHLAALSRLKLEPAEESRLRKDLEEILEFVDVLGTLDLPSSKLSGVPVSSGYREDEPRPSLSQEDAFRNAPSTSEGHFAVPPVLPGSPEEGE